MRYLCISFLLLFACSSDDESAGPVGPVLATTSHSQLGLLWGEDGDIAGDIKFRLISLKDEALKISWQVDLRNIHTSKTYEIDFSRLTFEDKDGFELARRNWNTGLSSSWPPSRIVLEPGQSREMQGNLTFFGFGDIELANSISNMDVWLGLLVK